MNNIRRGSIHLFRFAGVDLFLHWSWFLVAAFEISTRRTGYSSPIWNVLEYLGLFFIVMLHEYGHALACRQVGGSANLIVLWPLGGVAYVDPPPRPGATLWSIAAGPLVNVVLLGILTLLGVWNRSLGFAETMPNAHELLRAIWFINLGLLIFNLLPVYPLDGGQILRSLLWFAIGRARSLFVAAIIGLAGVAGLGALAIWTKSIWLGFLSAFILTNCWSGLKQARALLLLTKLPSHEGYVCPSCKAAPPMGNFWKCNHCGNGFDTFQTQAACPNCAARFAVTVCPHCGGIHPMSDWMAQPGLSTGLTPVKT